MGALPDVLPGYQLVTDESRRHEIARQWGLDELPSSPGLTVVEMMHAAAAGQLRAMIIMGENPMLSDPNIEHVETGLRKLDFLVVQDIFLSETAQLAHVVLPAASWMEKDGTFTNTERRVQLLQPVLRPPGEAKPDWQILCDIGRDLDNKLARQRPPEFWGFANTSAIMDELASVTPIYGGIRHARLPDSGLFWPCPDEQHPGTPMLHAQTFTRGLGEFHSVPAHLPAEQPDEDYPLVLTTGRILYHYHTGTMTRRCDGLT